MSVIVFSTKADRTGDAMRSAAVRRGMIFSARVRRIFSRIWKIVASLTEAEAA